MERPIVWGMADEPQDTSPGAWWHKPLSVAALALAGGIGNAIYSHVGGVTNAQFQVLEQKVTALAGQVKAANDVDATNHAETIRKDAALDEKVSALAAKVDKVLRRRKGTREQ